MTTPRKVSKNQFVSFLGLNVLVSAVTVLIVLAIWDRGHQLPEVVPTPTFDVVARLNDSIPTATATIPPTPTPITYTVKGGDTLYKIALKYGINIIDIVRWNRLSSYHSIQPGDLILIKKLKE